MQDEAIQALREGAHRDMAKVGLEVILLEGIIDEIDVETEELFVLGLGLRKKLKNSCNRLEFSRHEWG